ncbi:unnamed protein product [Echinostoma caproni]|uniref:Cilia- and flagella-associated protein 157 n=1 Tax=Echinostoma caproni TaxID=27848 RepID=A0A183AK84_9TREM|nr:unnamed protein product [Echinostoma caproni]
MLDEKKHSVFNILDSRDTEDLIEESKALKSRISFLNAENESLKSKCRQLNDQLSKKDKELASLTDPAENAKLLQSLGDNRLQTIRIFRQLHQKLFKLEDQLKEKDAQYNRIVTDLKYTRVEELRVQLDTAFGEIERLQKLAQSQSIELDHWRGVQKVRANKKKNDPEFVELVRRVKTLGQVIKGMDEQKKELIARNDYLVNRMHQILANDQSSMKEIEKGLAELNVHEDRDEEVDQHNEPGSVLMAKMVESKLSEGIRYQQPIARPIPVRNEFADELASARSQANSLELNNQQLRDDVAFYKKQAELTKSPKKRNEPNPEPILSKDEHSAILIQRAWRAHRGRGGLELRKRQKVQNMQMRAEARDKEAATQLIKSAIQGHLSRESSLRVDRTKGDASEMDEVDTVTFATDDGEDVTSDRVGETVMFVEEKKQRMTDLKSAIRGHLEREKSLNSLHISDNA